MCFLVSIKKRFCTLRLLFFIFKHFVRFLFEGGFYFLFLNILCGFYSRAVSNQGRLLFKKYGMFRKTLILSVKNKIAINFHSYSDHNHVATR